jgi:hypothetical protein
MPRIFTLKTASASAGRTTEHALGGRVEFDVFLGAAVLDEPQAVATARRAIAADAVPHLLRIEAVGSLIAGQVQGHCVALTMAGAGPQLSGANGLAASSTASASCMSCSVP